MKTKAKPLKGVIPNCSLVTRKPRLTKELLTQLEIKAINTYIHFLDLKKTSRHVNLSTNACLAIIGSALIKLEYMLVSDK
jgi:hypothetical protein